MGGWSTLPPSVTVIEHVSPAVPAFYLISAWLSRFRWLPYGWLRTRTWCRCTVIYPRAAHLRIHSSLLKLWRAVVHALCRTVFTHWLRLKRRKLIWGNNMLTGVWTNVEVLAHNLHIKVEFNTILYDDHWHRIFLFHHIYYDSCLLVTLQIKFDIQNIWSIYKVMDCHTFKNPILCKN